MESLYLLFLLVPIVIIIFPFTFDLKASYDVKENLGAISVRLWFIWLIVAKIKRRGKTIVLIKEHKNEQIETEINEPQLRFLQFFSNEVTNKLKVRKVALYTKLGAGDPFKSALFATAICDAILIYFARFRSKQPTASYRLINETEFYEVKVVFAGSARIALSLFDVLYSFVISILRTYRDRAFEEQII